MNWVVNLFCQARIWFCAITFCSLVMAGTTSSIAQEKELAKKSEKLVLEVNFNNGSDDWDFTDADAWKIKTIDSNKILSQFKKASSYKPEVRSPYHIALLKDHSLGDFQMDVKVLSTHADYGHRDVCLFFGYQSPTRFYYVHLGKKTDPHANQIFIVNDKERTKISTKTTDGTNWDDQWHNVRIKRDVQSGKIEVYFDDMDEPVMLANDKTFQWGRVGLGSFDDTADFDDLKLGGSIANKNEK